MPGATEVAERAPASRLVKAGIAVPVGPASLAQLTSKNSVIDKLQHVQSALRESQDRLNSIIQSAMDAILTIDEDQRIVMFNDAAEKMFGCTAADAMGQSMERFVPARYHATHREQISQFGAAGATKRTMAGRQAMYARRTSGEEFPIEASISQVETSGEKLFTVIVRDITERRRAEEVREWLAAVVESSDDAIISKTLSGTITAWNSGAEKLFGYPSAEVLGKSIEMLLPPDRAGEETEILARIGRGERVQHFETVRVRKDGRRIDVSATISPIQDSNGIIMGASKIARDISERKRAECALRSLSDCNESLMRATDESTLLQRICDLVVNVGGYRMAWVGYAVHDEKKTVRAAAFAGHEVGYLDTLHMTWADEERGRGPTGTTIRSGKARVCYDIATDPSFAPWREEALRRGYRSSMVLPLKSGSEVLGAISIYATEVRAFDAAEQHLLEELSNNLSYGITALRARQDRRQAEEKLARKADELGRSNADLEQFAYVASHDLQEPLRMVAAYTQLLAERYRGRLDDNADKFIGYASEGALRMQVLIQDLLAFSRTGRRETSNVSVDCNSVLREVLQTMASSIQESRAVITHQELPVIWADRTQIAQVFQNLIGNAIKFRREVPPVISIRAEKADQHWMFSVSDNGIGISAEHAGNIFVVFHRLHTRSEYPGNGIGLAICKKIIERGGGKIWVESQAGSGSIFRFTVPLQSPDAPEGATK